MRRASALQGSGRLGPFVRPTMGRPRLRRIRRYVAARHLYDAQFIGIELEGGELAAPHGARIDRMHAVADEQPQRGPVAAHDLEVALDPPRHFVPGIEARRLRARRALVLEADAATRRAVTQAGEDID